MSKICGAEHARVTRPGQSLGLRLDARLDEFRSLLLQCSLDEVRSAGREWLRLRYDEIVPLVLEPALCAVDHGRPTVSPGRAKPSRRCIPGRLRASLVPETTSE